MPGTKENTNAMRHGLKVGTLPARFWRVTSALCKFRVALEQAVRDARGEIGIFEAATIQTAVRWERHAALCLKWLREQHDDLSPDQRVNFSREHARASTERDKCIRSLGLDVQQANSISTIYSQALAAPVVTLPPHSSHQANGNHKPAESIVGADNGEAE